VFGPEIIPGKAGIRHGGVYWVTLLATLAIVGKLAAVALIIDGTWPPQLFAK
jgi:hypothetical protein